MGMPCNKGELTVIAEELTVCRDEVLLQFSGRNLDRKGWFGKYVATSSLSQSLLVFYCFCFTLCPWKIAFKSPLFYTVLCLEDGGSWFL
jgi:hypothetical protein